jgi:hypothetical protein
MDNISLCFDILFVKLCRRQTIGVVCNNITVPEDRGVDLEEQSFECSFDFTLFLHV